LRVIGNELPALWLDLFSSRTGHPPGRLGLRGSSVSCFSVEF
jgi:hypothetical protein